MWDKYEGLQFAVHNRIEEEPRKNIVNRKVATDIGTYIDRHVQVSDTIVLGKLITKLGLLGINGKRSATEYIDIQDPEGDRRQIWLPSPVFVKGKYKPTREIMETRGRDRLNNWVDIQETLVDTDSFDAWSDELLPLYKDTKEILDSVGADRPNPNVIVVSYKK